MEVRIYDYTSGKRRTMAVLRLGNDDRVVLQGRVPKAIEDDLALVSQRVKSGREFLRRLPTEFSGSYVRAKLWD